MYTLSPINISFWSFDYKNDKSCITTFFPVVIFPLSPLITDPYQIEVKSPNYTSPTMQEFGAMN